MTKKKIILLIVVFSFGFLGVIVFSYFYDKFSYYSGIRAISHIDNGLLEQIDIVPDEKTALKIAKSIWLPIYGRKNLFGYSYKIELIEEEFWAVIGVNRIKKFWGSMGGGPYIEIDKKTGTIFQVGHTGANPKEYPIRIRRMYNTEIEKIMQTQNETDEGFNFQ